MSADAQGIIGLKDFASASQPPPAPPMKQPWRQIGSEEQPVTWNEEMELDLHKECLRDDLELLGQRQVRILMLGSTGCGKSSFINSLYCALSGTVKQYTFAAASEKTVTPFLHHPYLSEHERYFRIQDTPGIMVTHDEFFTDFVTLALEGHLKEDVELPFGRIPIPRDGDHYVKEPGVMDRPCLVVFVWGPKPVNPESALMRKLDIAKELARRNKIKLAIVVTKADILSQCEAHPLKNKDMQYIFRSEAVLAAVKRAHADTGIQENCIFPVTNYTEQTEMCTEMNIVLLYTLSKLLDDAKLEAAKRLEAERLSKPQKSL